MVTRDEALRRILESVRPLPSRRVPLTRAIDCFAAQDLHAKLSLPLFDNSAMDGYAVVAASCQPGKRLRLVSEQPAGVDLNLRVSAGEAVRIFTGAPLPAGADAVVMQEDVTGEAGAVILNSTVEQGEHLRRRGCDLGAGQKILARGDRILPQTLPLLAAQGLSDVEVGGEVRVTVVSTGDELARPGAELLPGQLYESNSVLLQALLARVGAAVVAVEHCPDNAGAIEAALRAGQEHDVMVISGGVSVGARDLVKPALAAIGAELELWRVSVKPGKPFLFGRAGRCAVFGLPGNPVSAFVTFLLFVRPAILRLMGASDAELSLPEMKARLTATVRNDSDRSHYMRGNVRAGNFTVSGLQESHALYGLSRSNGLLLVEPDQEMAQGAEVNVLTWS